MPEKRKRSQESADSSSFPIPSLLVADDDAFPRGGGNGLSALEVKQASNEAARDLFGETAKETITKKIKSRSRASNKPTVSKKSDQKVKIESVSFKKLSPSTVVLGKIVEINSLDLTLALPNNLVGYVSIADISPLVNSLLGDGTDDENEDEDEDDESSIPSLQSLFKLGQWLRAVVIESSHPSSRHIQLSIEPEKVNSSIQSQDLVPGMAVQGFVSSVEDHGAIIDLGISKLSGFISKKELQFVDINLDSVKPGQVLLFSILSQSSNGRTITLTLSHTVKKLPVISAFSSIESITAGVCVEFLVDAVRSNGLSGKVAGLLNATCDLIHSGGQSKLSTYSEGQKVKARVICTSPSSDPPRVLVSFLSHIVDLSTVDDQPLTAIPIGHIVNEAKVESVDPHQGLFLSLGDSVPLGFVHISRISDERIDNLSSDTGSYKPGSVHNARVLGFSVVDNLYILSMEKKVLAQKFLRIQDIPVGQVLHGVVDKVLPKGGLLITISEGLTGIVPEIHMSDIKLVYPERKFKPGQKIKTRVLAVDLEKRRIQLTLKKTLVNSPDEILTSYKTVVPGLRTQGTIISFKPKGAIVEFFSHVRGYLPVSEISEAYIENPKDHFRLGQTVSVRVVSVDPEEQRMIISCRMDTSSDATEQLEKVTIGSFVNGTVVEKTKQGLVLEVEGTTVRGVLPSGHLTDEGSSDPKSRTKMNKIKVGDLIENILVLEKDVQRNFVGLTVKPSLVSAAKTGSVPSDLQAIKQAFQTNKLLAGFVKNSTNLGVFISFAGNLTGLALKKDLADDHIVENPQTEFNLLTSVKCRVLSFDEENKRFLLTLKDSKRSNSSTSDRLAVNPIDSSIKSLSEFLPGRITKAKVISIKETQLNVELAQNQQGRVDVSQVFDSYNDIKDPKQPLVSSFSKGQVIDVKIIGYHDARSHVFLPITHRASNSHIIMELSAKPKDLTSSDISLLQLSDIDVGSKWTGYINNHGPDFVWVNLSPSVRGRISYLDLSDDADLLQDVEESFPVGSALNCSVKEIDVTLNHLKLSCRSLSETHEGVVLPGLVVKTNENNLVVKLPDGKTATAFLTDIEDNYTGTSPAEKFIRNEIIKVKVLEIDESNNKIHVGLRPSFFDDNVQVINRYISGIEDVTEGDVLKGFVKNVADGGLFISLGRSVTARVLIKNLSDAYLTDWKKHFKVHQVVEGKVLSVNASKSQVELTLKQSVITGKKPSSGRRLSDFKQGDIVEGVISKVEDYGVFIRITDSANVSGLCHKSQIADVTIEDISKVFSEGDKVKAKILSVDEEKKRISLGLKASYLNEGDDEEDEDMVEDDEDENEDEDEYEDEDGDEDEEMNAPEDLVPEFDLEDSDSSESDAQEAEESRDDQLSVGFDWTGNIFDQPITQEDSSSEEDDEEDGKRHKKKKKLAKAVKDKTADLNTRMPQSVGDFERLLIGSPNSSILWMNFMAFQIQLSEIEKAREIGERALKSINFREEQEKLNIWIALLNLENSFGTEESLDETFKRAIQYMDSQTIHSKLASIYIQSNKPAQADALFQVICKKFGTEPSVWVQYATFLFDQGEDWLPKARSMLDRAVQALPKKSQVEVISKFALLEYTKGEAERGRTLFEGLLSTFPRRTDLWNVYIDYEIKNGDKENVRRLFERSIQIKMSLKQAKFFFKKWLRYEAGNEDVKAQRYVTAKAKQYVEEHQ